ncbi:hypothetical protein SAMD00019534_018130 [Acytostelium subglobosum LB1]|uniref:hypothetical protein n=1 Tax=Acytostelium subglobosum LB1 TaxID=1410327 RepID=UPI0006450966|nr:hypothetical protein SAMD00019534_018130 [Acytostelium subglobosum LB1]GAM18638.1 hypothetical protein SAMD00019534_018130 [Acytostelium subglobosum LB1]|eukprot:XP_012757858.1 hypothetical protein SAMD00019534_018130 [Acytostelium subglobosum LB1]
MVFEGIVSDVLSRVLGDYIKNLNKDQLKIGLFGGNVVLNNLELKEDALANLPINLPISVVKGFLGKLELHVPWKDLRSKPVIVEIESIYALAVPTSSNYKYDEETEVKKAREAKRKRVQSYELMKTLRDEASEEKAGGDSFASRLVTKIIDNLQVRIKKIHIRFENKSSITNRLYAVGVTLDGISAQSTDENWAPMFVDGRGTNTNTTPDILRKLAQMNSLAAYIDDDATSMSDLDTQAFTAAFLNAIPTSESPTTALRKFVFKPITSELKVSVNKSNIVYEKNIPRITADCVFSDITCALAAPQFHSVLNILEFTNDFLRDMKYLKYRPQISVSSDPRAWWRYAGEVTLEKIRLKRYQSSWKFFLERKKDRIRYIELYKRSLPNCKWLTPLTKNEKTELELLEDKLVYEDIIFYRSLAYAEIKKESEKNKIRTDYLDTKKSERGFVQNLFGWGQRQTDEKEAPLVNLSNEERDELYRTIEYSEVIESAEEPPEWVKVVADLAIKSIQVQLVENDTPFVHAALTSLGACLKQRKEGIQLFASLHQIAVFDQHTQNTLYPKVIYSTSSDNNNNNKFLTAAVDTGPSDKTMDVSVELNVEPLQVVVSRDLVMKIVDFFKSPKSVDLSNISNIAGDYIDSVAERTKMQLQNALDTHKVLGLSVKIQAPVIILPESVKTPTANALILDLGSLTVKSDPANQNIKGKVVSNTSEEGFYDKFNISLESIQLLLVNDTKSWNDKRVQIEQKTHIIDKFDVHLQIHSCVQQDSITLTKLKVHGELPQLSILVSDSKIKQLLCMAETMAADWKQPAPAVSLADHPIVPSTVVTRSKVIDVLSQQSDDQNKASSSSIETLINHKKISLHFKVTRISVTVSRESINLICLSVHGLDVAFALRTFDAVGKVKLDRLDIDDLYTQCKLKKLATSNPSKDLHGVSNNTSLVQVNFKQFQPNSPEYKKIDMTLDVNFQSFYLVCNPMTIKQLLILALSFESKKLPDVSGKPGNASPSIASQPTTPAKQLATPKKRLPSEFIAIQVTASINSLGVLLNQEDDSRLGVFSINEINVSTTMFKDTRMSVAGSLGSIVVEDLTDTPSLYKRIIAPHDEHESMLNFGFNTHPKHLANYSGFDSSFNANIKSIVINTQLGFIMQVQSYVLGGMLDPILNKPKPAIAETGPNKDKEDPQQQRVDLAQVVSRFKLDVVVQTPICRIPQSSTSSNLLNIELGNIIVSNGFIDHQVTKQPMDIMTVRLESTNITIVENEKQTSFLKKFNFNVGINRFLLPNHSIDVEDLLIDLSVSNINFILTQDQIEFFLTMADSLVRELGDATKKHSSAMPPQATALPSSPPGTLEPIKPMGRDLLVLKLSLPSIGLAIQSPETSIATLELKNIYVDFRTSLNQRTKLQATLESIRVTDDREASENIFKNLLENYPTKKGTLVPFIHFGYIRDNLSGDQLLNIEVNKPCLFVSPTPFIMIAEFFMQPLQAHQKKQLRVPEPIADEALAVAVPEPGAAVVVHDKEQRVPTITLNCSLKAEMTLVENETQPNTRCITAKTKVKVTFKRLSNGAEEATVSVVKTKVDIFRPSDMSDMEQNTAQGSQRPVQILKPIEMLQVQYSKSLDTLTQKWKQSINVSSTIIKLFFSYDDINTMLKVAQNLSAQQQQQRQQKLRALDRSPSSLSVSSMSSMASSANSDSLATQSASTAPSDEERIYDINEILDFKCPSISILLINESSNMHLPIAELYIKELGAKVTNWSSNMELTTSIALKSDYFNESIMKFEPFIEDWSFRVELKKDGRKMRAAFIATQCMLNVNISHALLQTLATTVTLIKAKDKENNTSLGKSLMTSNTSLAKYMKEEKKRLPSIESPTSARRLQDKFQSHWIMNMTGDMIAYEVFIESEDKHDPTRITLENDQSQPIHIKTSKSREDSSMGTNAKLNIFLPNGSRVSSVMLDAIGHRLYPLEISQTHQEVDVECRLQRDGSKIIHIRSLVEFVNSSSLPIHVKWDEQPNDKAVVLPSSGRCSLPLKCFNSFKKLYIKLVDSHHWSDAVVVADLLAMFKKDREKEKAKDKNVINRPNSRTFKIVDRADNPAYMAISVVNEKHQFAPHIIHESKDFQTISFLAPVQIENLLPIPFTLSINKTATKLESGSKIDVFSYIPGGAALSATISGIDHFSDATQSLLSGDSSSVAKHFKLHGSGGSKDSREIVLEIEKIEDVKGVRMLAIYCPYWLVNNSMLDLVAKGDGFTVDIPTNNYSVMNSPILYHDSSIRLRVKSDASSSSSSGSATKLKYCASTPIVTVGHTGSLSLPSSNGDKSYAVSYTVDFCHNSKFRLSKVVTLSPRYVVQNKLDCPIQLYQTTKPTSKELMHLQPNEFKPLHWLPSDEDEQNLCFKTAKSRDMSGAFAIDMVQDLVLRLRGRSVADDIMANISIKEEKGTNYIMINHISIEHPPYLIQNDTPFKISYQQKCDKENPADQDILEPGHKRPFAWDDPSGAYILNAFVDGMPLKKQLKLKKITCYRIKWEQNHSIYVTITVERSSRVVMFSTHSHKFRQVKNWKENCNTKVDSESSAMQLFVRMSGIGLSIIDQTPKELCYLSLQELFLQMDQSEFEQSLEVKIGDIQIDNQLVRTEFPVLLYSVKKPDNPKDFLHMSVIKSSFDDIDHFRYFSILIQEMMLEVEDHWLKQVLDFATSLPDFNKSASSAQSQASSAQYDHSDLYPVFDLKPPAQDSSSLRMVYFALLVLNPIMVSITLSLQPDGLFKTDTKILSSIEGLGFTLTKLDRAPISLQGLFMQHPFSSWSTLIDKLKSTYIKQALRQFYNILGSVDVIGNPVGLFRNFGTGVQDFFVEPAQGLVESPAAFGKGLAKGTTSLLKNSVYGTFNSISKITGTIGSGIATLSFDDKYLQERKAQNAKKPKHLGEGLAMGGIGLGKGLFQGITGIVTKPIEGAKRDGMAGLAKGLVQGVVGVAVKPATAVIDMTTKATEGIRNTTNLHETKDRSRPPRYFGADQLLKPFEMDESTGWFLLKSSHKGKHSLDNYFWHCEVNDECTIILSDQRLIYQKTKKSILQSNFLFQIPYTYISAKETMYDDKRKGIVLKMHTPIDLSLIERSVTLKLIPVKDGNIATLFKVKLDYAMAMMNAQPTTITSPTSSSSATNKQ